MVSVLKNEVPLGSASLRRSEAGIRRNWRKSHQSDGESAAGGQT